MKKSFILALVLSLSILTGCSFNTSNPPTTTQNEAPVIEKEILEIDNTETLNWPSYTRMGVTIKYPSTDTYSTETPSEDTYIIAEKHPGNRVIIKKTTDPTVLDKNAKKVVINNKTYRVFNREGMGDGYGYVIKRNEHYYIFESTQGPKNEVFELMMSTVKIR